MKPVSGAAAVIAAPLLVSIVAGAMMLGTPAPTPETGCGPAGAVSPVDLASLPTGSVAGYQGVQLANAAAIVNAGLALGLDAHGQTIGVMTAMGESDLTVVDHGDAAGPDSRGLFQQRAVGWGSYADRMNPTTSATNYFRALIAVPAWNTLAPTIAAHRAQKNADPYYYAPFWPKAVEVVAALAAAGPATPTVVNANLPAPAAPAAPAVGADAACLPTAAVAVTAGGWTKPAVAPITSPYGMRMHPVYHTMRMHTGTDLGAPCRAPIMAAHDGVVVGAGPSSGYGNLITIDHGGGTVTRYAHMFNDGVLVRVGDKVTAGQQIARVGSNGVGTACHLHYEVRINNNFTDPVPFMVANGAPLGT